MKYYQCKLRRGDKITTGWIPARGAKVGNKVELHPNTLLAGFWEVLSVGNVMGEDMLKQHQKDHRKSFASIEPMA